MKKKTKNISTVVLMGTATLCLASGIALIGTFGETKTVYASEVLDCFTIKEEASVRRADPNGIRFTTELDETTIQKVNELKDDGYTVSYGTIVLPTDMLGDEELTFDTEYMRKVPQTKWQEEGKTYTCALVGQDNGDGTYNNLPESYYNRPISARGYIECTSSNGDTVVYYTANTAERSIGYVALMAQLIEADDSTLISDIVSKTNVEVVLPTTLSANVATENALVYNAFENSVSVLKVGGVVIPDSVLEKLGSNVSIKYRITGDTASLTADGNHLKALQAGTATVRAQVTLGSFSTTVSSSVTVTDDFRGATDYKLLLAKTATQNEKNAAQTIQKYIFESTGATLPIQYETGYETTNGKYISVGETKLVAKQTGVSVASDKATSSVIKTVDNALFLRGKTDLGTLWGANQLLNTLVGYEFYQENTYALNAAQELGLPADAEFTPDIEHNYTEESGAQQGHSMLNFGKDFIFVNGAGVHNSVMILNEGLTDGQKYSMVGANWKEWYATDDTDNYFTQQNTVNGVNQTVKAELCYTAHGNATVYQAMVSAAGQRLSNALNNDTTGTKRVAFGIRDTNLWCKCDACKAITPSNAFIKFLNDVCKSVELSYEGDYTIITLAYHHTNEAPTTYKPDAHVEIWFGESYGDYTTGIANANNTMPEVYTNFQNWVNVANVNGNDILWWTYYLNVGSYFVPYNNLDAIRENYALAVDSGIDAMFNEILTNETSWSKLKTYIVSKLAWNAKPTDDEWNGWIDSYFANAYGNGATQMRNFYNSVMDSAVANYKGSRPIHATLDTTAYFTEADLRSWLAYADAALAALDMSDPNYEAHYNNIMLERAAPTFLLLKLFADTQYTVDLQSTFNTWGMRYYGEHTALAEITAYTNATSALTTTNVKDVYVFKQAADGSVLLENANLLVGETWTVLGKTYTVTTAGDLTVDLSGMAAGEYSLTAYCGTKVVNFPHVWVFGGEHRVTANIDEYYQFNGAASVADGETYTFTVAKAVASNSNLAVVVNGNVIESVDGVYAVENVTSDLNIGIVELSHRTAQVITSGANYTQVNYKPASNVYNIIDSVYSANGTDRLHGNAYIDGGYLAYMYAKGFRYLNFTMDIDGTIAKQAILKYNGTSHVVLNLNTSDATSTEFTLELVPNCNSDVEIWAQNERASGAAISGKGGMITVKNLAFLIGVSKPTSPYFTFEGEDTVQQGADYTFTLNPNFDGYDEFIVLVNGKEVSSANNTYTIANVQSALDIQVLHGYVQVSGRGTTAITVENGAMKATDAVLSSAPDSGRPHGDAYISKEYIEYMMSKGYNKLQFTIAPDKSIAVQVLYQYNGSIDVAYSNADLAAGTAATTITIDLVAASELEFWGTNSSGSGAKINGKGSYILVSNVKCLKSENITLANRQDIDLDLSYSDGLVSSSDAATLSIPGVSGNVTSITLNGVAIEGASFANETLSVPKSAFGTAFGEATLVVNVASDTALTEVTVPVLLITKAISNAEELDAWYVLADALDKNASGKSFPYVSDGYFVLDSNFAYNKAYSAWPAWNAAGGKWRNADAHGFKGTLDGRGYSIDGLEIATHWAAFITLLHADGELKNIGFTNAKLTSVASSFVTLWGGGTIENVYVQYAEGTFGAGGGYNGTFFATDNARSITENNGLKIYDCFVDASKITAVGTANKSNFIGYAYNATASNLDATVSYVTMHGVYALGNTTCANKWSTEAVADGEEYNAFTTTDTMASHARTQNELRTWNAQYWTIIGGIPTWNSAK